MYNRQQVGMNIPRPAFRLTTLEKILKICDGHEQADQADRDANNQMTCQELFAAFMKLAEPYYANAVRRQRGYRVDDLQQRMVCDHWGFPQVEQ